MPGIYRIDTNTVPCWAARFIKCNPNLQAYYCFCRNNRLSLDNKRVHNRVSVGEKKITTAMENKHLAQPSLKAPESTERHCQVQGRRLVQRGEPISKKE